MEGVCLSVPVSLAPFLVQPLPLHSLRLLFFLTSLHLLFVITFFCLSSASVFTYFIDEFRVEIHNYTRFITVFMQCMCNVHGHV